MTRPRLLATMLAVVGWTGLGLSIGGALRIGPPPRPLADNIAPAVAILLGWSITGLALTALDALRRKDRIQRVLWWAVVALWGLALAWVAAEQLPLREQIDLSPVGRTWFATTAATAFLTVLAASAWASPRGRGNAGRSSGHL